MAVRDCDAIGYLRLQQQMKPSDSNAVLKDGSKLEVFMFNGRPVVEIDRNFYEASAVPGFVRFELKPVAAPSPLPELAVQDNWVDRSEPVDILGQRLRAQLLRNPDVIYTAASASGNPAEW